MLLVKDFCYGHLLKTEIHDSEYNFIDEEFKSIEVEGEHETAR